MIQIERVQKRFGNLHVLHGIDLTIQNPEVHAIIGPNSSGKTTLIKCILGLVFPDNGDIHVNGHNVNRGPVYRHGIGYLPQIAHFPSNLTVREFFGMLNKIRGRAKRMEELTEYFGIGPFLNKKMRFLSGGTRQKVNLVQATMWDAEILILDEPTVGLDPVSLILFKDYVRKMKNENKTILLTTHIMSLVEELADKMSLLLDGRVYFEGTPNALITQQNSSSLERAMASLLSNQPLMQNTEIKKQTFSHSTE